MKRRYYSGLQPLAMALIFTPEPLTTIAGIGLLGYAAHARRQAEKKRHRLKSAFKNFYNYKINKVNNSTLSYQIFTTRQGQLPLIWPDMTKLYYKPQS